ncbi:MAG: hypothetical protein R3C14_25770 [Caldilineaceae bacterium]
MAAITPAELLQQWRLAQITPEMAIGQLIQNQVTQQALLEQNSRSLSNLRADADRLITHTKLSASATTKRKPPTQS